MNKARVLSPTTRLSLDIPSPDKNKPCGAKGCKCHLGMIVLVLDAGQFDCCSCFGIEEAQALIQGLQTCIDRIKKESTS